MIIEVKFKHVDHSDALEAYVNEKTDKLKKYFDGKVHVVWNFGKEHGEFTAHCHVTGSHLDLFGESAADDIYATVDLAIGKVEKQLRRHKEIITDHS